MWKVAFAGVTITVLLVCLVSIVEAADPNKPELTKKPEEAFRPGKTSLLALGDEYIRTNYEDKADIIIGVIEAIDRHKDRARELIKDNTFWTRAMQGGLILLAFLTTVFAAVARTYRNIKHPWGQAIGLLPIISAALVTLMSSSQGYYNFGELRDRHTVVANELATLQSDISYELMRRVVVAEAEAHRVEEAKRKGLTLKDFDVLTLEDVDKWYNKLSEVLRRVPVPEGPKDGQSEDTK